jgi:hypothetical protein
LIVAPASALKGAAEQAEREVLAKIAPRVLNSAALSAESQCACDAGSDRRRHALWRSHCRVRGQALGYSANRLVTGIDPDTGAQAQLLEQASLYHANPTPGRWTLILYFAGPIVGDELSQPFRVAVLFNQVDIHASGLPTGAGTSCRRSPPATRRSATFTPTRWSPASGSPARPSSGRSATPAPPRAPPT